MKYIKFKKTDIPELEGKIAAISLSPPNRTLFATNTIALWRLFEPVRIPESMHNTYSNMLPKRRTSNEDFNPIVFNDHLKKDSFEEANVMLSFCIRGIRYAIIGYSNISCAVLMLGKRILKDEIPKEPDISCFVWYEAYYDKPLSFRSLKYEFRLSFWETWQLYRKIKKIV